jgi:hypothetical protein
MIRPRLPNLRDCPVAPAQERVLACLSTPKVGATAGPGEHHRRKLAGGLSGVHAALTGSTPYKVHNALQRGYAERRRSRLERHLQRLRVSWKTTVERFAANYSDCWKVHNAARVFRTLQQAARERIGYCFVGTACGRKFRRETGR